jgi:hypothetical protein
VPLPVSPIESCGFCALLSIVSVPIRAPKAVGENRTVTVHLDLGLIVAPHPFAAAKSPPAAMLENVTVVVLLLFSIVTCLGLLTPPFPNTTLPSLSWSGDTLSVTGTGVIVGVAVGVTVAVGLAVGVAVAVAVAVRVAVAVAVGVRVAVLVAVRVALAVAVEVAVAVAVLVAV